MSEADQSIDLVVLKVEGLEDSIPLELSANIDLGQDIKVHGFSALTNNGSHALRTLEGTLGDSIFQSYDQGEVSVESWDLVIRNESQHLHKKLKGGYSGSPVVDLDNKVIGIVSSQLNTEGSLGAAISATALTQVWPELPYALQRRIGNKRATRSPSVNRVGTLNFSQIISRLSNKFRQAPENVTDPDWLIWFREMFALQHKTLEEISFSIGSLLGAHRTTVYFLSTFESQATENTLEHSELWSLLAQGEESLEIRVPVGEGVSGTVAATKETIFIPYDAYKEAGELKHTIINQDNKTGYRTYSLLTTPFFSEDGNLIAIFQFLNKLKRREGSNQILPDTNISRDDIDKAGFSLEDQDIFESHILEIRLILELYQEYYRQFKKLQSIVNFSSATLTLSREGQDLEDILKQVINEARRITHADRGTFWLLDSQGRNLKAKVPVEGGKWREFSIKVGEGFAGGVAKTEKTLNIPFDLYDHPASSKSKETDITTGYRTCSLLCMPVFSRDGSRVIGVTQLLNKRTQQSFEEEYQASNYSGGVVPDFFRASFTPEDELRLSKFNEQVAAAIESSQQPLMTEQYKNLNDLLQVTSQLTGKYLNSHRARIFFVDEESGEVWSIISDENSDPFEISIPFGHGDLGELAISRQPRIVSDIHQKSLELTSSNSNSGYFAYSKLLLPLFTRKRSKKFLAIIEFINKLKIGFTQSDSFSTDNLDESGFSQDDIARFNYNHAGSIVHLVNGFLDAYKPVYQYREGEKLRKAKEFVIQSGASSTEALDKMMTAAQDLVVAHRSTLWRIDPDDREILYAFVPSSDGGHQRITATIGEGYVGQAAAKAIEMLSNADLESETFEDIETYQFLNIGFDLYDDRPRSDKARETDKQTKYRTCSLLCMPILSPEGELLGVIQLLNKLRRGFESQAQDVYQVKEPPPECFMASFSKQDERQMADFCSAVGYVLKLLEVRQEVLSQSKIREFQDRIDRINQQDISHSS